MRDHPFEILIEWDDNKNKENIRKHGISFETAKLVFADKNRIEYYDQLHSFDEDRYVVLGMVHNVLFVIYTIRKENIRIISARCATKAERDVYYGKRKNRKSKSYRRTKAN